MDKKTAGLVDGARRTIYIQLGSQSQLAERAINGNCLIVAYPDAPHDDIIKHGGGDDAVIDGINSLPSVSSKDKGVLRDFYTERKAIWITFWDMRLWWTFAKGGVTAQPDAIEGELKRRGTTGWSCESLRGDMLYLHNIGGVFKIGKGTMRPVHGVPENDESRFSYLRNLILGEKTLGRTNDEVEKAKVMISRLDGNQLEWFTEVLFNEMEERRVSPVGGTQKDIDMVMEKGNRTLTFIQVKGRGNVGNWAQFVRLAYRFHKTAAGESRRVKFCFVYNESPPKSQGNLDLSGLAAFTKRIQRGEIRGAKMDAEHQGFYADNLRAVKLFEKGESKVSVQSLGREELARMAVKHGLSDWLRKRVG